MKKLAVILAGLILVALAASAVLAEPNEPLDFSTVKITLVGGNLVTTPPGPFFFSPKHCDRLYINNQSGVPITVTNTQGPGVVKKATQLIANGDDTKFYEFCCPNDETKSKLWEFEVTGSGSVTFKVKVYCTKVPSLTPFGVAALLLLLAGATMWMLKRRTARTTA
jgi:hypothetical protein